MTVKYNVTGTKRKELVQTIANWMGCDAKYLGAPSFAYEVAYFNIDKDGALSFDDNADNEVIERLLEMLYDNGFEAESLPEADEAIEYENTNAARPECNGLIVNIPLEKVAVGNLTKLLDVKGKLIKKALGIDSLPFRINEDSVSFFWLENKELKAEEVKAYSELISMICQMTINQKRITATEKEVDNEKYAFRCFLLRLGFIGTEYKEIRKVLLRNLEGSSAFKSITRTETEAE